ncbi:hypothetical protein [Halomonas korlensis]|uniref:Uncharacterized protein n=1 Tax=Halomonas korlensis TaxID=463301 RepID=A0A1I7KI17_9GAMM|nr:hypothetical protein [Halomonas korlensis]SFU97052.1 hypothetical protein SAMN04487955_12125 [Halomonas korlensis]
MTNELDLLEAQQAIHELIAQPASLEKILEAIARWIGLQLPGAVVAFMRFDSALATYRRIDEAARRCGYRTNRG